MRPTRITRISAAVALVLAIGGGACGDEIPIPPRSLSSPAGVASSRACVVVIDGLQARVRAERCEEGGDLADEGGTIRTLGLIANRRRQSLMLLALDDLLPALIDTDRGVPGVTGIPVCEGPSFVETTPDGKFAVITCDSDRAVSIVDIPNLVEIERLPRPTPETAMDVFPDEPLFVTARPDWGAVVVDRLTWDCDGSSEVFPAGCEPEVSYELETVLPTPGRPNHLVAAREGVLFVTYEDLGFVSEFSFAEDAECLDASESAPCELRRIGLTRECRDGIDNDEDGLIDRADLQCFGPDGAESPEGLRGRLTACTDGEDNDDDGFVDHEDVDCISDIDDNEGGGVVPIACSDGEDNDDDGLIDAEDPECVSPAWGREDQAPACADGEDNDGDGDTDFPDDGDCADALWSSEEVAPACADGVDNDGDGETDFPDDEDCLSPLTDADEEPQQACNNGVDDDLDGFVDRADPGCSSPMDDSEIGPSRVCADGADNDDDGLIDLADPDCYGSAGLTEVAIGTTGLGPMGLQEPGGYLLVADQLQHQLRIIDLAAGLLIDTGADDFLHPGIGIPVSNAGVIAPSAAYERGDVAELDNGTINTSNEQIGIAPVSNGFGVVIDLVSALSSTPPDGPTQEGVMPRFRPRDGVDSVDPLRLSQREATTSDFDCELPDDYRALVRASRPPDASLRVSCGDPEVPSLGILDPEAEEEVLLVSETRYTLDDDGNLGETESPIDWRLRDESWTLSWEGVIPDSDRSDGIIDEAVDGLVVSVGPNFCRLGIEVGDRLIIEESRPALTVDPEDCTDFEDVELEYEIEFVRSNGLYLRTTGEPGHADRLPPRDCFAVGFTYEIRVGSVWLLDGSRSGFITDWVNLSQQCVLGTGNPLRSGRVTDDVRFENFFFELEVATGTVQQTRGVELTFDLENNFATTVLNLGPTPIDFDLSETAQGRRLSFSDGGVNTVYIFDAATLFAIANVI